jgi:phosphoglycolate phosphatase
VGSPKLVLFDLDGTLIDSAAGIFSSLDHAFAQIGVALPPREVLRTWIGPPFHQSFPTVLGDDAELVEAAIAHYRDHYIATGWAGHAVYPGIAELIQRLAADGRTLAIVTTKVSVQAKKIVAALPFGAVFAQVYGAELTTAHSAKAEMVAQALSDFAIAPAEAAMIGDRHFDIAGARANAVRSIGVSWGFGSVEELTEAGAHALAHAPHELAQLLAVPPAVSAAAMPAAAPVP